MDPDSGHIDNVTELTFSFSFFIFFFSFFFTLSLGNSLFSCKMIIGLLQDIYWIFQLMYIYKTDTNKDLDESCNVSDVTFPQGPVEFQRQENNSKELNLL